MRCIFEATKILIKLVLFPQRCAIHFLSCCGDFPIFGHGRLGGHSGSHLADPGMQCKDWGRPTGRYGMAGAILQEGLSIEAQRHGEPVSTVDGTRAMVEVELEVSKSYNM